PREDELLELRLRYLEPITRLKIFGEHRARKIDRENDVDSGSSDVLHTCARAWTREREDERHESNVSQNENESRDQSTRARSPGKHTRSRKHDRVRRLASSPQPP